MTLFRPKYFFIGVSLGFILCCFSGYIVSKHAKFENFHRFIDVLGPQFFFYPTASELLTTAESMIDPNKKLVLVGGSSVFRGAGQNPDELWSDELQRLLGSNYTVINYANDGASFTSFGAVAFRMLIERHPTTMFVATCNHQSSDIEGNEIYNYLFWDAYYKKLFHPDAVEAKRIYRLQKKQLSTAAGKELHFMSYLDSLFYFKDLWTWVGYKYIFTVWNIAQHPFHAKRKFDDPIHDFKSLAEARINNKEEFQKVVKNIRENILLYKLVEHKTGHLKKAYLKQGLRSYEMAFSPRYRPNVLCIVRNEVESPRYYDQLPAVFKTTYPVLQNAIKDMIETKGYHSMVLKDMTADDYADPVHLLGRGGKKAAAQIAEQVKKLTLQS